MLGELRARHPQTVMIAEANWDREWELQQHGFNFCYDKRLYDRIIGQDASAVRDHLRADLSYQSRLVRFLENHDEPRIASRLDGDAERAAARRRHAARRDLVARRTVRGPPGAATALPLAPPG